MYWRRFAVSSIPIDDSKAFEIWLRARWTEKDKLLDGYLRTRRFPADEGVDKARDGKTRRGAGYIETEIKASHWYEFLQIFAPIGLFALVLYMFYGALPRTFLKSINKQAVLDKIEAIQKDQIKGREKKLLISPVPKAFSTGLKKAAATQETASKNKSTQKALHDGGSSRKVDMEAATTQKPAIKQGIIRKAPLKEMTTQKASITGVPSQQAQVNVAKKQQQRQQQTSAASKELRTKQETSSTPKKLEVRRETNSAPKMLNIKHKVSSTPRKLESKKPEAKHEASSTSKKLGIKHEVTSAPKKHEPKKLEPKKLDVKNEAHSAPKKVEKIPNANSETRRAPTKLEIRQKTSPSFKTKQNTRQAPKKSDTRS